MGVGEDIRTLKESCGKKARSAWRKARPEAEGADMMCDVLGEVHEPAMLRFQASRGSAEGH